MNYAIKITGDARAEILEGDETAGVLRFRNSNGRFRAQRKDWIAAYVAATRSMHTKADIRSVTSVPAKRLTLEEHRKNVRRVARGEAPLRYWEHTLVYGNGYGFNKHPELEDYAYSLLRVYKRYNRPERHFSQIVTALGDNDRETLAYERIYVERTLFGRLINALPYENRLQFVLYAMDVFSTTQLHTVELGMVLELLRGFVSGGLLQLGRYLVEANKLVERNSYLFGEAPVGFIKPPEDSDKNYPFSARINTEVPDDIVYTSDNLADQAALFAEIEVADLSFDQLFSTAFHDGAGTDREFFYSIFSKRPLPIDLTIDTL